METTEFLGSRHCVFRTSPLYNDLVFAMGFSVSSEYRLSHVTSHHSTSRGCCQALTVISTHIMLESRLRVDKVW
jgi:hypothetical protein